MSRPGDQKTRPQKAHVPGYVLAQLVAYVERLKCCDEYCYIERMLPMGTPD